MSHREYESSDHVSRIHNNGEVRHAAEGFAGSLGLLEVVVRNADLLLLCSFWPASTLDRNTHDLLGVWVPGDDVDSSVVHGSTLKSVFREPIEHEALAEVTRDLRVPCTLVYPHIIFRTTASGLQKRSRTNCRRKTIGALMGCQAQTPPLDITRGWKYRGVGLCGLV